jgi:hypothetical protein
MFPIPAFVVLAMVGMALNKTRNESKRHSGSKAREEVSLLLLLLRCGVVGAG